MNIKYQLLLVLIFSLTVSLRAQQAGENTIPEKAPADFEFVDDNRIAAALDSLSTLKYFENTENTWSQLNENKYNFLPNFIPTYPDSVYYYRMQRLDVGSPISLVYNQRVRAFIDLYANRKRGTTARVLGLAQMYFPMFEQQLDKYNIPLELKYLAIVESALNSKARSSAGAGGLWQFMYYTGKIYGLELTSYVDDRNDPLKATVAACRHFNDLYNMYHDWLLVLAAYNSGPGNVNKAIRRSGGKMTFWEIMPYLPRETRDYVPAFIAVNYVMAYSNEHNIYPVMPKILYHETDTIAVHQPLTLSILSDKLSVSISDLEFLNPTFRTGFIPATPDNPFYIRLPKKSIADFINNEPALYAYYQLKGYDANQFKTQDNADYDLITKRITHKVRKGETLSGIAMKYDCSPSEIKKWNKLKKSSVYKGQALKIYVQSQQPKVQAKAPKTVPVNQELADISDSLAPDKSSVASAHKNSATTTVSPKYHVVKKGESLGKISSKYKVATKDLMVWNHMKGTTVQIGQKIRINAPVQILVDETIADNKEKENAKPVDQQNHASTEAKYHVVKKGEYLTKIASTYGISSDDLVAWNSLESNNLLVGQKLRVNQPDSGKNAKTTAQVAPVKSSSKAEKDLKLVYYTVKPGDTLWSIAQHYDGITIDQLKEWNKLSGKAGLKIGQKIKVILPAS